MLCVCHPSLAVPPALQTSPLSVPLVKMCDLKPDRHNVADHVFDLDPVADLE
jgi:hypothetical protein